MGQHRRFESFELALVQDRSSVAARGLMKEDS
jgi:hypothetical protein